MSSEETISAGERVLGEITFVLTKPKSELKLFAGVKVSDTFQVGSVNYAQVRQLFSDIPDLHEEIIKKIIAEFKPGLKLEPRRIAKGEEPINGRDGRLLMLVKPFNGNFRAGELERVDPKFVRAFDNIEIGSVVARIYPPTPGTPGKNYMGGPIPPVPGKPFQPELDPETLDKKDNPGGHEDIISKARGYLSAAGNKLKVERTLTINGDVSFQTGDIDFIGAVDIKGEIRKDFRVEADAEIIVRENVTSGSLVSRKSSVVVHGSVIGDLVGAIKTSSASTFASTGAGANAQRSEIVAKTTVTAKSLENVYVECNGDLFVEREIRKCSIVSRGAVRIPKGSIIGGECKVVCGLEALEIGNAAGSELHITLLSDIESSAEYVLLKQKHEKHLKAEHALELHLGPIASAPGISHLVSPANKARSKKVFDDFIRVKKVRLELEAELAALLSGAHFNQALRVNVIEALYPGVTIHVGTHVFSVQERLDGPKTIEFVQGENKFEIHELTPVMCDLPGEKKETKA
jgi:uncharacterized protein (DUF342 family)